MVEHGNQSITCKMSWKILISFRFVTAVHIDCERVERRELCGGGYSVGKVCKTLDSGK